MKIQLQFGFIFLFANFVNALDLDPIVGIIGGSYINIEQAPWQAHLQFFDTRETDGSHYKVWCGGSIIHEKWILSAAHCTQMKDVTAAIVRVGTKYSNEGGKIYHVKQIIRHGRYNDSTINFDFALLELTEAIEFDNRTIKAIPLPSVHDSVSEHQMCFVSGWGSEKYNYISHPKVLKGVEIPIVSNAECEQALSINIFRRLHVTKQMMCAGFRNGGENSCKGDSGGSLICSSIDGERKLFGVVSWGINCGFDAPGVFSRVQTVRLWIKKHTGF